MLIVEAASIVVAGPGMAAASYCKSGKERTYDDRIGGAMVGDTGGAIVTSAAAGTAACMLGGAVAPVLLPAAAVGAVISGLVGFFRG